MRRQTTLYYELGCWLDPDVRSIIRALIFIKRTHLRYAKLAHDVCLK
jgi:hypothetical protein